MAIVGATRYGARTAILGDNIANRIVSIGFSKGEKPVSSYTILSKSWESGKYEPEHDVLHAMETSYEPGNILSGEDLESLLEETIKIKSNKADLTSLCETINTKMENDWREFWK